jgi:hypothetical protein
MMAAADPSGNQTRVASQNEQQKKQLIQFGTTKGVGLMMGRRRMEGCPNQPRRGMHGTSDVGVSQGVCVVITQPSLVRRPVRRCKAITDGDVTETINMMCCRYDDDDSRNKIFFWLIKSSWFLGAEVKSTKIAIFVAFQLMFPVLSLLEDRTRIKAL